MTLINNIQTSIRLIDESLVPLGKSGTEFPYPVGRKAVERYVRHGIRGTRLESIVIGNRRFTSREAIQRFVLATNKQPENVERNVRMTDAEIESAKKATGIH